MFISPEHQRLKEEYEKLVLKNGQYDLLLKQRDQANAMLKKDVDVLRLYVEDCLGRLNKQAEEIASFKEIIYLKDKELEKYALIAHQFDQLKREVYGRKSEKSVYVSPGQLQLELSAEVVESCNINNGQLIASYTKTKAKKNENHPGRKGIPAHFRREYVDIYPSEVPPDAELFDTEETEQLEFDPGRLFATVYRRFKYKRTKPDGSMEFFIGDLPVEKDKCLAAPSLRAHCAVEKYMYHMPLYRQIQKFKQEGINIAANTMSDWVMNDARSLTALLSSPYDLHSVFRNV